MHLVHLTFSWYHSLLLTLFRNGSQLHTPQSPQQPRQVHYGQDPHPLVAWHRPAPCLLYLLQLLLHLRRQLLEFGLVV